MYVLVCALGGAPFEEQQEQGFEEPEQQQQQAFDEGKWTLDHIPIPMILIHTFTYMHACAYNLMGNPI